ncbi:MAG: (Fe-S)-binding protein [Thermodesulfobacteriota bacterium]
MEAPHLEAIRYRIYRCTGFGICRGGYNSKVSPCPMQMGSPAGFEAETPRGIMTTARGILEGELDYSTELAEVVYRCTQCGNCRVLCGAVDLDTWRTLFDPGEVVLAMRTDLVERGLVPPRVRDYLKGMQVRGRPYLDVENRRGQWARDLDLAAFSGHEYLLYAGDAGAFDERGRRIAQACALVFQEAGLSFGVLGDEESADGNEVLKSGEKWLFEKLAQESIAAFRQRGVKRLIAFSPHAFNAFKNEYPALGADLSVRHHSQVLAELLGQKKLKFSRKIEARVAFHDPCLLGRQNEEYEAPRQTLRALPGVELVEMPRARENALCCGGGGGNFFTDMSRGIDSPARRRLREARDVRADVLAVACPKCAKMLEDASKLENLDGRIRIMDLAEIVQSVL